MINEKGFENPCGDVRSIRDEAYGIITELIEKAKLKSGMLLIVGCSSSEIIGCSIGKGSSFDAAEAVFSAIYPVLRENGIMLAVQCCEHLNRCVILEREAAEKRGYDIVNAVPQPKAGGSLASIAYSAFEDPVAVEKVRADAGLDIGQTLIGMHLREVAVPLRLSRKTLGEAVITAARTRPRFIGGSRTNYDEALM